MIIQFHVNYWPNCLRVAKRAPFFHVLVELPHEHGVLLSVLVYQKDLKEFREKHPSDGEQRRLI